MVQKGYSNSETMQGNGDCVLLDFYSCFFAVSDSSDRNPAASRDLVVRFDQLFRSSKSDCFEPGCQQPQWESYREDVARQTETILSSIPATTSCTLTAIKFVQTVRGWKGLLLHTGDSMIYSYASRNGKLAAMSQRNFWLAGRTRSLYQIEWLDIEPDALLIMTTDGVSDGAVSTCFTKNNNHNEYFGAGDVQDIPELLLKANKSRGVAKDDAAVIAIKPRNLKLAEACVIMGGTTVKQEKAHVERCGSLQYRNQDIPMHFKSPQTCPII